MAVKREKAGHEEVLEGRTNTQLRVLSITWEKCSVPFDASQMTEFLFCPYSVSHCNSEPARTGTCITSISCTCSSLVMYICCRESSSSLFLSSRVFPSSAARWRSRKKAEMRQTNDQSVLHFVSVWNSNYRGSRARRRERRNFSLHLHCSLLREYEGQGLAPLHRDKDEKRLNLRWSLIEEYF